MEENDLTVVSIFVNPAQFAPHEDLATYPRTLPQDLEILSAQSFSVPSEDGVEVKELRKPSALFLPTVNAMYPSGISQNTDEQKGTFVEVKGYSHQMEGRTRPTFFRGVATVVTKLFNAVEVCLVLSISANVLTQRDSVAHECLFWAKGHPTSATIKASFQGLASLSS